MEKTYIIIKTVLFVIVGILIFVFNELFLTKDFAYLPILVGSMMAYYGLESIITLIVKKGIKAETVKFLNGIITLMLGIIVLTKSLNVGEHLAMVCILWSVWSIMREGEEIFEKTLKTWDVKAVAIINALESIVVIVYSIMLMFNPVEHHIRSHVILLGVELILEVAWGHIYSIVKSAKSKQIEVLKESTLKDKLSSEEPAKEEKEAV